MGVSKAGEDGRDRPRTGGGLQFQAKEVLVGSGGLGVSRIFPENLPPQALLPSFLPFFLPLTLPSNSFTLKRLPSTLQARPKKPFLPQNPFSVCFPLLSPLLDPFRTPSESLHRVPQKAQNSPFQAFLGVPQKPPKRG